MSAKKTTATTKKNDNMTNNNKKFISKDTSKKGTVNKPRKTKFC
jgi:hypothetical protein